MAETPAITHPLRRIPLSYTNTDSRASALRLILALRPEWENTQDSIEFHRFTDGITNTLLKAVNTLPGLSQHEIDQDAILLRAYGRGTEVLIDRERERRSHELLSTYRLAPTLYARFDNGLLYKYIEGSPCGPDDLRRPEVYRGVARRLGEWHATLPISNISRSSSDEDVIARDQIPKLLAENGDNSDIVQKCAEDVTPNKPVPNIWTVMQKWVWALPGNTEKERKRKAILQGELDWLIHELGDSPGIDDHQFVFAHCDLLCGNVIKMPSKDGEKPEPTYIKYINEPPTQPLVVHFIDYEYATPAPASFDIANHFAEWGGFDCDYGALPTRSQRRDFLNEYLKSYNQHLNRPFSHQELNMLFRQVDIFRGVPGFYWGVWAMIQAVISQIDFDYASYAETRLGEYWAWKAEVDGTREEQAKSPPLRESRWAQEDSDNN